MGHGVTYLLAQHWEVAAGISTTYKVEDILSYVRPSLKKQKGKKWVKEHR